MLGEGFNPYFIGLPILIAAKGIKIINVYGVSILILLDYLFLYFPYISTVGLVRNGFNPYFIGLPILILRSFYIDLPFCLSFNPYFIGLPILIRIASYTSNIIPDGFNPYFIGLPILIF